MVGYFRRFILWMLLLLITGLLVLQLFQPTHEGPWIQAQAELPGVEIADERVFNLLQIRDFRYHSDTSIASADYRDATYELDALERIWLGVSHFSGMGLAHAFVSFEFAGGEFLAVSFEARLRPGQSYSPVKGLLNQYPKILVLGTEEDILGLRSHVRKERVLLYELQLTQSQQAYLFTGLMHDVAEIEASPRFYNTLLDNCVTSLLRHDPEYHGLKGLLDYRVLLPGFGDGFAQEKGWIRDDLSLAQLRLESLVDATIDPMEANFSQRIRGK